MLLSRDIHFVPKKNQNFGRVFFSQRLVILLTDPKFHASLTLNSNNSPLKSPTTKSTTFLKSSGRELSHGGTLDMGSTTKNPRKLAKRKKGSFLHFLCPSVKKFQMAANRTILVREEMPTAHLKAYVPNFPKHP